MAGRGQNKRLNLCLDDIADVVAARRALFELWAWARAVAGEPSVTQVRWDQYSAALREVGMGVEAADKWLRAMMEEDDGFRDAVTALVEKRKL